MSNGIEIIVQIRARETETHKDLPTYFTESYSYDQSFLDEFDGEEVVEDAMEMAVREVVGEWAEEYKE